ncbi:hypothetical protein SprV_1002846300 [Sparganum proliferum]
MQNARTARKPMEIQGNADHNEWQNFFFVIKAIYCPPAKDSAIARLPQVKTNTNLDLPLSLHETIRSVQQLSSGIASVPDAAPAKVYKHGGPQFMEHLTALFQAMWCQGDRIFANHQLQEKRQ